MTYPLHMNRRSPAFAPLGVLLALLATEAAPQSAAVTLVAPADQDISNQTTNTFTATASATAGLTSATLLVGGPPGTVTFTGPAQVLDTQLTADTPATPAGGATTVKVDGLGPHSHGLLAFPALIGGGGGQVPPGAVIASATLRLNCTNAGNLMALYRLTEDWDEGQATWNERRAGVPWSVPGADGPGSRAGASVPGDCTTTGQRFIAITPIVQAWSDGAPNFGMVLIETGTDGVNFDSSESGDSPLLTVVYSANQQPAATQALSGTAATASLAATLPVGTHYWNIEVTDANGATARGPADFELTIDPTYPDAPVLFTPADGTTGASPASPLAVRASDPAGGAVTVQISLRKAAGPEFTIIAMPDTQFYSETYPAIFTTQTQWIVANKTARNIAFVTHEGDIVQNAGVVTEWDRANTSMSLLDGVVPYGVLPGNHDQPTTLYNQYFPWTRYAPEPWYGGHYQDLNDNNFQLFSAGGLDFVIVHLVFCPPAGAVAWADGVLKAYPDRIGIVTTHGYLNGSAQRSVSSCASTQYLWDGLAVPNPNLHFMLSGHVSAESRRSDVLHGHPVHQMLADYQDRPQGGEGWLRILRFVPGEDKVHVTTYSPWLNRYETDADSQFSLDFQMSAPMGNAGSVVVPSGGLAALVPAGLAPFTEYEWQVTVTNGTGKSRAGPLWRFTTGANVPPADADADGVADVVDNCTQSVNAGQCDSDGDGYGNRCDADLNNNGATNAQDTTLFRQQLGEPSVAPGYNKADLNCNGAVNAQDTTLFRSLLGLAPGPSALGP